MSGPASPASQQITVVGAGVFGLTAALELHRRGADVRVLEQGQPPHPDAASTDISKLVRMDYGTDAFYTEAMERAFTGWEAWNQRAGRALYHPDGIAVLGAVRPGTFEGDSHALLTRRGHTLTRSTGADLGWHGFDDGYINPRAGWAESGEVVRTLAGWARDAGILIERQRVTDLDAVEGDTVVVACGAWTHVLLPELADRLTAVGQPVLHFRPTDPERFRPPRFLPWAADIATTGWYGFPATADGIVKVANHGTGRVVHPDDPRAVDPAWEPRFRAFLRAALPDLADAPVVHTRLCLYSDSFDGNFLLDRHPDRPRVVVAAGGSGHGFKFAPVLGPWIADAVEGHAPGRFCWRNLGERRTEDARAG